MRNGIVACLLLAISGLAWSVTAITYQGQLQDNDQPFNGQVDMTFELFDDPDPAVGNSIAGPIQINDVDVVDGLFQVNLNFGNVYDGERFLHVTVGTQDLLPRQRIAQTPVAMLALNVKDGVSGVWEQNGNAIQYTANNQGIWFIPDSNSSKAPRIVMGHASNEASAEGATVSGGGKNSNSNIASGPYSTIGGGADQQASGYASTIAGGGDNRAMAYAATIAGGANNEAQEWASTVAGGDNNDVLDEYSTIGGGWLNLVQEGAYAVISGGGPSDPDDRFNTRNIVFDNYGVISGGGNNRAGTDDGDAASAQFATIGGGEANAATARGATVSGGAHNLSSEELSTVGGGVGNQATGLVALVAGGFSNIAAGSYSTVAGGIFNEAAASFSHAAGRRAKIQDGHSGTFLWADSTNEDFFSTAADQFRVRASGGMEFETGSNGLVAYSDSGTTNGAAVQAESSNASGIALAGRNKSDDATLVLNNTGVGPLMRAFTGGTLLLELRNSGNMTIAGTLTENSDRNAKEGIQPVDNQRILQKLVNLDITTWRYKDSLEKVRHIGPMAQDFHALFGFGQSNTTITGMDVRGVALAAIQALHEDNLAMKDRLDELEAKNTKLQALAERNSDLEQRLSELEALLVEGESFAEQQP